MNYSVKPIRAAGLLARWTKTRSGAPIIAASKPAPAVKRWYVIDATMWKAMQAEGIQPAFDRFTVLGDIFYVPA